MNCAATMGTVTLAMLLGNFAFAQTSTTGAPSEEIRIVELQGAVEAAGFEVETLLTEPIGEFSMNLPMWHFLEEHGYNTSLRGEQTYCVAIKRPGLPVTRYPKFLYAE